MAADGTLARDRSFHDAGSVNAVRAPQIDDKLRVCVTFQAQRCSANPFVKTASAK